MFRAGLVLLAVTMAGATAPAAAACLDDDQNHIVFLRQTLHFGSGEEIHVVVRRLIPRPDEISVDGIEVTIFGKSAAKSCGKPIFRNAEEAVQSARVDILDFPWFRGIDIVREYNGELGSNFSHQILAKSGGKLADVTPKDRIGHSALGGFFMGPLPHRQGNGFSVWGVSSEDDDEAQSFPFLASFYRWNGAAFKLIESRESEKKYTPRAAAEEFVGLPAGTVFNQTMPHFPSARNSTP